MAVDGMEPGVVAEKTQKPALPGTVRLGLIAAASAVAGGLAVAWWHRKTLQRLNNPIAADQVKYPANSDADESDGGA